MEGELGAGARIAIALIVLSVVISVIFVILGFTRGTTNEGILSVQNAMDNMQLSTWDDYDQKTKSGAEVQAAMKLLEGKAVAVIIANTKPNSAVIAADTSAGGKVSLLPPAGGELKWTGVNYGAQIKKATATSFAITLDYQVDDAGVKSVYTAANFVGIVRGGSFSYYVADIDTNADGSYRTNNNVINLKKSGHAEYVRPTAKYMARLIKDTTGTIVGVVFVQVG